MKCIGLIYLIVSIFSQELKAEWKIYEKTNIKGTITGVIKRGKVLETTSGRFYEVTGITIQVVVEVMPECVVLSDGAKYKLIIKGFDEPLICKLLNPKVAQVGDKVISSRIKGEFEGWDGDTIFLLDNGQVWKQSAYAYFYKYAYRPEVTIIPNKSGHLLKVEGVSKLLPVELVGGGIVNPPVSVHSSILKIDNEKFQIHLTNGKVWSVMEQHQKKLKKWRPGDKVKLTTINGINVITKIKNFQFVFVSRQPSSNNNR